MNNRLASLTVLVVLAACSTNPTPHYSAAVKDVATGEYLQYWRMRPDSIPLANDFPREEGCMRLQVVIDSDGKIVDSKVLAVVGSDVRTWIPTLVTQLRFDPAPGNSARTPVRTVLPWTFNYSASAESAPAATGTAAMKAKLAAGPTSKDLEWSDKCKAQMDQQMAIGAAPAAMAVSQP